MELATAVNNETHCRSCGAAFPKLEPGHTGGVGFAIITIEEKDFRICYKCCGNVDRREMKQTGKAALYLVRKKDIPTQRPDYPEARHYQVTNWCGSLKFNVQAIKTGSHNIAGTRMDVWFRGPDNKMWWGVHYGSNNTIVRCRRVKK